MNASPVRRQILTVGILLCGFVSWVSAANQKKIVTDFEDYGTWRLRENYGVKPGAWWPASICLSGSNAAKFHDDHVGELKFAFDPESKGPFILHFERTKMTQVSGFLDGIEFDADAQGHPVSIRFQIIDAANRKFPTESVALSGEGWQHYRLDLNAETVRNFKDIRFPARLHRISLEAQTPSEGTVFLDDIALTGKFTKKGHLSLTPIYEGIYYPPNEPVTLRYRIRNARPEVLSGTVEIQVRDLSEKEIFKGQAPFTVDATGSAELSFEVGSFPVGAYEVALGIKAGDLEVSEEDHFGVMIPNNGQPNQRPMWFGICDQNGWQGELENERHLEWMKLLGIDINRFGIFPDRFEPSEGMVNDASWAKMIEDHAAAGVDLMVLYDGSPPWTHKNYKWRSAPDIWPKYEEHASRLGAFLKQFPNVTSLEFHNEPDLDFFHGDLDGYLEMFRHFAKGFRKTNPDLPFTSGGVTVKHPREKEGFSKGMFLQAADLYDIAAYHSHGPAINNEKNHAQVKAWLDEAGLQKRFFNTETGDRSLYTPEGRRRQAIGLVKKITVSKAQPGFDAYFWFTLQDYWDMDPEADDSFGLVSSDNRAKASFVAYNTLIRALANTTPVADAPKVEDLTLYAFQKDDGRYVYAGWPEEAKSSGVVWIKTKQNLEVTGMLGDVKEYEPLGGILPVSVGELPLYISGATPGEPIQICPPEEIFLQVDREFRYTDAKSVALPVRFRNPSEASLEGALILSKVSGGEIARQDFKADPNEEILWNPAIDPTHVEGNGLFELTVQIADAQSFVFPIHLIKDYLISKVEPLGNDPAAWPSLEQIAPITIDRPEQVIELAYDPNTPSWKGPEDLSATARLVHDGKGIRFQVIVTDDVAGEIQAKDELWRGDNVQVAFGQAGSEDFTILDLGKSSEGAVVWCPADSDTTYPGQWDVPIHVERTGTRTVYDAYLPFNKLGISPDKENGNIRFTFMVNEDDGKGRVRWIEWTPGIARDRTLGSLGYGKLQ